MKTRIGRSPFAAHAVHRQVVDDDVLGGVAQLFDRLKADDGRLLGRTDGRDADLLQNEAVATNAGEDRQGAKPSALSRSRKRFPLTPRRRRRWDFARPARWPAIDRQRFMLDRRRHDLDLLVVPIEC